MSILLNPSCLPVPLGGDRRLRVPGGCYFFNVNLLRRQNTALLIDRIDVLRHAMRDAAEYAAHMDCVHFNPVRHGYVDTPTA